MPWPYDSEMSKLPISNALGHCLRTFIVTALSGLLLISTVDRAANANNLSMPQSQMILLEGGMTDGKGLAGIDIRMEPHVKTYWRMPGDSGLPPIFDWSGSDNLAEAKVLWPLPQRIADPAGSILGYDTEIIFPVRVTASDQTKPVHLVLKLDYAVCGSLCVPVTGHAEVVLAAKPYQGPDFARINDMIADVPASMPFGAQLVSVMPDPANADALLIETKQPLIDLFVEGPDGWYIGDGKAISPTVWRVMILQKPTKAAIANLNLTLTLVSLASATETSVTLDASGSIR